MRVMVRFLPLSHKLDRKLDQKLGLSLKMHLKMNLNINMNLPSESGFEGAAVYFVDPATRLKTQFEFKPGVALMHRGAAPHASLPITKGERRNMVLWLYGAQGEFSHYPYATRMNAKERWTKPEDDSECAAIDRWSPF